jgi:carboxymethylenebutenolidase
VREELYDIARRVGTVGYYCMVPDFYYRNGKRVHFEFRNENNQTISINRLEGQALREIQARPKLSNQMVMDDTGAILKFLDSAEWVRRGNVPGTFRRVGLVARDDAHLGPGRFAAPAGR